MSTVAFLARLDVIAEISWSYFSCAAFFYGRLPLPVPFFPFWGPCYRRRGNRLLLGCSNGMSPVVRLLRALNRVADLGPGRGTREQIHRAVDADELDQEGSDMKFKLLSGGAAHDGEAGGFQFRGIQLFYM